MSLIVTGNDDNADFVPAPAGTFTAICNMVVDLGLQKGVFQNKETIKPKVYIRWELPTERILRQRNGITVEEPQTVGCIYTRSLHQSSKLRKHLEGWRGRAFVPSELTSGFDLFKLAGTSCQVNIKHETVNDRIRAKVEEVVGWPKGMPRPKATEIGVILYSPDKPEHLPDVPQWLKTIIDKQEKTTPAKEAPQNAAANAAADDLVDPIPF